MSTSVRAFLRGRVQGVGFRYYVSRCAQAEAVTGYAINLADGRVEVLLQGDVESVERVLAKVRQGPSHARVDAVSIDRLRDCRPYGSFSTG